VAVAPPSGTITFLFTDIEGSTRQWEAAPAAMRAAQELHDDILRTAITAHGGHIFSTAGDGLGAAFARVGDALDAAVAAQAALAAADWPEGATLRVRMGAHTGEAHERGGDYFGPAVNRAARVMAIGNGGQVLCSAATAGLISGDVALLDLGEHRLRDLSAPQRVFQIGEGRFPPLRSPDLVPTNLPIMATGLVGRDEEVRALCKLVADQRLVTLTGPGGVGKTRLALEVAASAAVAFPDGTWLVELAPLGVGGDVARAVATALGSAAGERGALMAYLADRSKLLVLDNCDYVVDEAADLATAMLASARDVRVLATSQEPLSVPGEVVHRVGPLELPDETADPGRLLRSAAVRLLVERTHAANPQFNLNAANAEAVGAICRELDGVPLALELAAARARAMPVAEIARRLGERFHLLGGGSRGAEERHRTLSFDLEAAEEVVGGGDELDVLECVLRLVDRSLVAFDTVEGRYRLGQTLRQYAADRLEEASETEAFREAHARYFAALASRVGAPLPSEAGMGRQRLAAERDNLRGVAEFFASQRRWPELLGLSRDLFLFLYFNDFADGFRWYRQALDEYSDLSGQDRVDALGEFSALASQIDFAAAEASSDRSIEQADIGGLLHSPWAWQVRGIHGLYDGDGQRAVEAAARSVAVADERSDDLCRSLVRAFMAAALAASGQLERSEELAREVLEDAKYQFDPAALWMAVLCLASTYLLNCAPPRFAEGLAVLEANPLDLQAVEALFVLVLEEMWGLALLGHSRAAEAVTHLARSIRIGDGAGMISQVEQATAAFAIVCADGGEPVLATQIHGFASAKLAAQRIRTAMRAWLDERLDTALASLDSPERAQAIERGSRLDRRGFMQLVAQAEDLVG
jgi:predicted ATPase/class 3 adenylate cyclase